VPTLNGIPGSAPGGFGSRILLEGERLGISLRESKSNAPSLSILIENAKPGASMRFKHLVPPKSAFSNTTNDLGPGLAQEILGLKANNLTMVFYFLFYLFFPFQYLNIN
jgi:hypothetical protein